MGWKICGANPSAGGMALKFIPCALEGLWLIQPDKKNDERGFFVRTWCRDEFQMHGLNPHLQQSSLAFNEKKSTLRGMHFQKFPHGEIKIVLCLRGVIYDVVIDLRPESKTFCQWKAFELSEENPQILYIPEGFAHGYQTLTDGTLISYHMNKEYQASAATGVRWDDPAFCIRWPAAAHRIISEKDLKWPDFDRQRVMDASFQRA